MRMRVCASYGAVPGSPAEVYAQAHTNCTFIPEAGQ